MPNPLFVIEERKIVYLTELEFVDVMNRLLKAEAQRFGIPSQEINTTMRQNDPDGGVDARIEHNVSLPFNSRVPEGLSVWQYKHGDSPPREIVNESLKPGIQDAIVKGGAYCYVICKGYSDKSRKSREKKLREVYEDKLLVTKAKLFTAQDVADWVSDYPSVAMLPYFQPPVHDELLTFEQWLELPELRVGRVSFVADDQRRTILAEIGNTVSYKTDFISLRITGRAGVGKTRFVLETIRANKLDLGTLYARSPESIPTNLFSFIEANPHVRLILVVDETTYLDAIRLHQLASRCGYRCLLITIGHDLTSVEGKNEIDIYKLNELDDEAIKKVITNSIPTLPQETVSFVVNVSGGYVKLATALADSIVRNPGIVGAARLSGMPDVSIILESLVPDDKERKVMEVLSLLRRVGLDGDVAIEGQTLARFMGIDFVDLKRISSQMIQRGLVVKRGRYRYVTPHLLAVWFAASIWEALSENIVIDLLLAKDGLSPNAAQSLLERLADLGEEKIATPIVELLLSDKGLFSRFEDLNDDFRSRIFATLADAAPKVASDALDRILGHLPRDRLLRLDKGRRQIVWVLEKLLLWEDTFWNAARLLLRLAEAENESYANNATGVWCSIYQTHLGNTPVPAIERHRLIQEALESELVSTRLIGVQALQKALSTYETGISGLGAGGYIPPQPWRPKNWKELWEVRRSALQLLDRAIGDKNDEVVVAAKNVLINTATDLVKQGLFDDVIPRLQNVPISTEQEKIELWEVYKRILHFLGQSLKEEQRTKLIQISDMLLGDSYHDRLRRWLGKISPVDWKELKDQDKRPEEMVLALAEEGFADADLLQPELSWMGSEEAVQRFLFFKRLGELDEKREWLDRLIDLVQEGGNPNLLSAYLLGRSDSGDGEWVTQLLDEWSETQKALTLVVYETIWRLSGSQKGAARIIRLIDKGWLSVSQIGWLGWGKWVEPLPSKTIDALLNRLIQYEDPYTTEISLVLLMNWLEHHQDEASTMLKHASKLLTRTYAIDSQNMLQFYWEQLANYYIDDLAVEISQAILQTQVETERISTPNDARLSILQLALTKKPKEVWPLIGEVLLRKDTKGFSLRLSLRNWGVEQAGINNLIDWAKINEPLGPCILAELAMPFSELAERLLLQFGDEECVGSGLAASYLSGSFWGSEVQWFQSKLEMASKWANDERPAIREWAQRLVRAIVSDIKRARQREEEEELFWG